jgi:hypothetical protein
MRAGAAASAHAPRYAAEDPVCTDDGVCFDIVNIVPYIKKHGRHPVTGAPLELKDLTRLTFARNADGEHHCPVLNKARQRARRERARARGR